VTTGIVPCVSGGQEEHGHLEEFRTEPIALMHRVREECGDFGIFHLAHKKVVLSSGAQTGEFFFRASDEDLDQAEAYPFMTQIVGEGVGRRLPPCRSRPSSRFCCASRSSRWPSRLTPTATITRRWRSSCNARPSKMRYCKRVRL
jgi:hypothetical protein